MPGRRTLAGRKSVRRDLSAYARVRHWPPLCIAVVAELEKRHANRWEDETYAYLMAVAIITGSGGLIGSQTVHHFVQRGFDVVGLENDMRGLLFGPQASTAPTTRRLTRAYPREFRSLDIDIRDSDAVMRVVRKRATELELVVHTAAQPSHDWAASDAQTDFTVNANGTLNLLEAVRQVQPAATFIHMSTNKVYGDRPNNLPLYETDHRLDLPVDHEYYAGIPVTMPIDHCLHSLFGASKVAADVMVQEYGRYFDMPTVCFRGGCLTGPGHAGTKLHGFLSYLMKCTVTGETYTVFGYGGKQVRDNIHAADVVRALELFHSQPRAAAVYNLGGGRASNISVLEAISLCQRIAGRELRYVLSDQPRTGDHRWYISDFSDFKRDYPGFDLEYGIEAMLREIHDTNVERWLQATTA
jgi:CDP-paratose 2-epimerase